MCKDAVTQWNGRVLIVAHVKELLEQSVEKLQDICPMVKVGVYSAGLGRRDTEHDVIVGGVQSIYDKAESLGRFDLMLIDE
ncbi:DEAD/DEAH box helicase family protein, partial [Lacticaseibacillus paracasei]